MPRAKKSENKRKAMADLIKKFRADFLMSQTELAAALGCSRRTIQYAEGGKYLPKPETISLFQTLYKHKNAERLALQKKRKAVNA